MDKQLVSDLKTIIQARKTTDEVVYSKQTNDIIRFMDPEIVKRKKSAGFPICPVEPTKPQKSAPPQMPEQPLKPAEPTQKQVPKRLKLRDMSWSYPKIYPALPIISAIMILIGFFMLLQGPWGWIVVGIFTVALGLPYIVKMIREFASAKEYFEIDKKKALQFNEDEREKYEAKLKQYDEAMKAYNEKRQKAEAAYAEWQSTAETQYSRKMEKYEAAMERYRKSEAEYEEELKRFNEINDEHLKEIEKATELRDIFNEGVRREAEGEFEKTLASLTTYVPPKYVGEAEKLLEYILDARADTLKEAIELLIKEQQEQAREIQRAAEADQAAEQAEELIRIQKGIRQCSQCRNRSTCYRTATNDGDCSSFSKNDQLF